jgi:hypothetical protein
MEKRNRQPKKRKDGMRQNNAQKGGENCLRHAVTHLCCRLRALLRRIPQLIDGLAGRDPTQCPAKIERGGGSVAYMCACTPRMVGHGLATDHTRSLLCTAGREERTGHPDTPLPIVL